MSAGEHQFDSPNPEPPKSGSGGKCLLGCLGLFVISCVLCAGGGYYISQNWQRWAVQGIAKVSRDIAVDAVKESDLTEEDKRAVIKQFDRIADEAERGNIDFEKLQSIVENIVDSPVVAAGIAKLIEVQHVNPSDLPDDEKAEARLTLQRVARGVYEKKIDTGTLNVATEPIMEYEEDGERRLKENVTTDELREFLANIKQLADDAQIPEEPFEFNVGEEVKKAVDKALAED